MDTQTAGKPETSRVYDARGLKVMLEDDLAAHWGVEVEELLRAVHDHDKFFTPRMCFRLAAPEAAALRRRHPESPEGFRHKPLAFTARGSALLATYLDSPRAREANAGSARVLAFGIPPGMNFDFEFCRPGCGCDRP